jgi:hypothetical protein
LVALARGSSPLLRLLYRRYNEITMRIGIAAADARLVGG